MEDKVYKDFRVITEHAVLKERFPLGYEGKFYSQFREEDKVIPGFWTKVHEEDVWVEEATLRKGEFIDVIFIDINGGEVSSTMVHNWTGKSVGELFKNLSK